MFHHSLNQSSVYGPMFTHRWTGEPKGQVFNMFKICQIEKKYKKLYILDLIDLGYISYFLFEFKNHL